jgi:fatty-acyl-CoA synthase
MSEPELLWHYGDLIEAVGQRVPERIALIHGGRRRTWEELHRRSNRLARNMLAVPGINPGDHIAYCMPNCDQYLEALSAGFKARLVHQNINYRYLDDELFEVLDDGDSVVIIYHAELARNIERLAARLSKVRLFLEVGDGPTRFGGARSFEEMATSGSDENLDIERSEDDILMIYTGGTTGRPKGVMWRMVDRIKVYKDGDPSESPSAFVDRMLAASEQVFIPGPPLMHSTGLSTALRALTAGGTVVTLPGGFDPGRLWDQAIEHRVTGISIVGDAFGRPLLAALTPERAAKLSSLTTILSAGVMWSCDVKLGLIERLPGVSLIDTFGSSEGSGLGRSVMSGSGEAVETGSFSIGNGCKVFTADHIEVEPGSGEPGMIGKSGAIPVGYYKDPEGTETTFPVIDGVRYAIPGDWCVVEADGTITLLGRGSNCINTGGEKVFPEEVEEALKAIDGVDDALAFGIADDRWGQAVTALVSLSSDASSELTDESLRSKLKSVLAGYKVPKRILLVDAVPRQVNGKANYKEARALAETPSR